MEKQWEGNWAKEQVKNEIVGEVESWSFFGLSREVESLIRTCWEITVSLRAIGPFYVYVMHMHGLEQSSGTRYLVPHKCTAEASLHCGPEMHSSGCGGGRGGGGDVEQTAAAAALEARCTSIKHPAVPHLRIRCSHHSEITAENDQVMAECITADVVGLKEVWDERLLYRRCRAKREREKKKHVISQPLEPETFFPPFSDVCQHRQNQSTSPKTIRQRQSQWEAPASQPTPPSPRPASLSTPHLSQQIKWRGINFCSSWWAVTRGKEARGGEEEARGENA